MKTANEITLEQQNDELKNKIVGLEALVKFFEAQLRLAKHRQFGKSSEKTELPEQLNLFDEAEATADPKTPEEVKVEDIAYTRKKRVGKRADDLSKLPVETVVYELDESECICPECEGVMHSMSVEERCEIEIIPAQFISKRQKQRPMQSD